MSGHPRTLLLCEGYHDRAFLAGWLLASGCSDPSEPGPDDAPGVRKRVFDPVTKLAVAGGGRYAFVTPMQGFVVVVPCGGDGAVLHQLANKVKDRSTEAIDRIVVCLDADDATTESRRQAVAHRLGEGGKARGPDAAGDWIISTGGAKPSEATTVSLMIWSAPDPEATGLPRQQTLERLVCAAISTAYPARASAVHEWLKGRPKPPEVADHKAHAWSHMAGWFAGKGCDAFYRDLWDDSAVALPLKERLEQIGATRILSAMLGEHVT